MTMKKTIWLNCLLAVSRLNGYIQMIVVYAQLWIAGKNSALDRMASNIIKNCMRLDQFVAQVKYI